MLPARHGFGVRQNKCYPVDVSKDRRSKQRKRLRFLNKLQLLLLSSTVQHIYSPNTHNGFWKIVVIEAEGLATRTPTAFNPNLFLYLSAASSLDWAAARVSLTRRPSSSLNPTSSAEASARLLYDSPVDLASSRSAERRCSRALSSLVLCVVWHGVVRRRTQHNAPYADEEKGMVLYVSVVHTKYNTS